MWKKPDVPTPSSVQKEVVCLSLQRAFCFVVGVFFFFLILYRYYCRLWHFEKTVSFFLFSELRPSAIADTSLTGRY